MGKEQFKILPNSLVRRVNLILAVYFQIPKSLSNSRSRNTGLNTAARANKVMLPIVISWLSTLVHYMSICRRHVYIHMVCVCMSTINPTVLEVVEQLRQLVGTSQSRLSRFSTGHCQFHFRAARLAHGLDEFFGPGGAEKR